MRLEMITPTEYTGSLMELAQSRRGIFMELKYLTPSRSTLVYEVRKARRACFQSSSVDVYCRMIVCCSDMSTPYPILFVDLQSLSDPAGGGDLRPVRPAEEPH